MTTGSMLSAITRSYDQYLDESNQGLGTLIQKGSTGGYSGNITSVDCDFLLLFNKDLPMFHNLPYRVLLHLPSLMTRLGIGQVTYDHIHFWAWTAESLNEVNSDNDYLEKNIERLFLLVVDYAVGRLSTVPVNKKVREENAQISRLVSPHAQRAMDGSHQAATQLSYPVLEGLLRRLCNDYVLTDGSIKSGKSILKMNGEEKNGGRANNIGNLLYHYENRVAPKETSCSLKAVRSEMANYSDSDTGYKILNSWRHPHSHGGERLSGPEHVVTLNIICQLIWDIIPKSEYENINKSRYSKYQPNSFEYYPLKETRDLLSKWD